MQAHTVALLSGYCFSVETLVVILKVFKLIVRTLRKQWLVAA